MSASDHANHPPADLHLSTGKQTECEEKHEPVPHPPSPIITRRDRRQSLSERAATGPVLFGNVKYFCRQRGHGYITPRDGGDDIFLHVSDIEGEYVPCGGDLVSYQACPIPPKFEKAQAIHVSIKNLAPGSVHERWAQPPTPHVHPHPCPNTPEYRHPEEFHFPNAEAASHATDTKNKVN